MNIYCSKKNIYGFGLVEAVVSIGLSTIVIFSLINLNVQTTKISLANSKAFSARMYLTEAIEAGKDLELSDWSTLTSSVCTQVSPCHPVLPVGGGSWSLVSGTELLDGIYTRSVWIDPVYRNNGCSFPNEIDTSGCLDPDTLILTSTISWKDSLGAHNLKLETYLYNIY